MAQVFSPTSRRQSATFKVPTGLPLDRRSSVTNGSETSAKAGSAVKSAGNGKVNIGTRDGIYKPLEVEPANITIREFAEQLASGKALGEKVLYAQKLQVLSRSSGGEAMEISEKLPRDPDCAVFIGPDNVVIQLKSALKKRLGQPTPSKVLEEIKSAKKAAAAPPPLQLHMQGGDEYLDFFCDGLQGGRDYMEDRTLASLELPDYPSASLFGILDGHGGQRVAELATKYLPQAVGAALKQHRDPRQALMAAFAQLDQELRKVVKDTLVGSTCVVCLILRPEPPEPEVVEDDSSGMSADEGDENVEVTVWIDRELDIKPTLNMGRRASVEDLKKKIAELDISGGTKPEAIALKADGRVLGDSECLGSKIGEIDVLEKSSAPAPSPPVPKAKPKAKSKPQAAPKANGQAQGLRLFCAHIGDSRAVMCRKGQSQALTEDHKPEVPKEEERVKKAGGTIDYKGRINGGLNLSRAFGDYGYKMNRSLKPEEQLVTAVPDVTEVKLLPTDQFLVMASDGVYDVHENQEVVEKLKPVIKGGLSVAKVTAHVLLEEATESGDNVSLSLVRFKHPKGK